MSDTIASLRRKIASAGDLQSVVRTMKALAASNIGQYEESVRALSDYYRVVELGLGACLRAHWPALFSADRKSPAGRGATGAIVFGSDQGLVGQFNEVVAEFALDAIAELPGETQVWAVGERVHACLSESGVPLTAPLAVPTSVDVIGGLVDQIVVDAETRLSPVDLATLHLFYNRPTASGIYEPVAQRLLPLDDDWHHKLIDVPWPTARRPEVLGGGTATVRAFIREYLFISIFRACAESLASENASRLSAMQRADKNIEDLLEGLEAEFHRVRQTSIDEELFDVISGVEALSRQPR